MDERAQGMGVKDLSMGPAACWPSVALTRTRCRLFHIGPIQNKDAGEPETLVSDHLREKWAGYMQIYTDGSKNLNNGKAAVGISILQSEIQHGKRISDHVSVFTTELVAILWALGWVENVRPGKIIICSDSTAALMGGTSGARPDLIVDILTVPN